jgi:lysophospholipase L1-like esterase
MKESFVRLLIVFVSTIISIFVIEGGLRLAGFNYRNIIGDVEEGIGWKYLPNQKKTVKNLSGRPITITINSLGFRGNELGEKREGRRRILLLGDSFAFGFGVSDNETVPYYLEEMLKGTGYSAEVVNGGIGGTTIFHQKGVFEKYGDLFDPDEVLLLFCLNDIGGVGEYIAPPVKPVKHSELVRSAKKVVYNTAIGDLLMKFRLSWISGESGSFFGLSPAYAEDANFEIWYREFMGLAEMVAEKGIPLTVAIPPLGPKPDSFKMSGWSVRSFTDEIGSRLGGDDRISVFPLFERFPEKSRPPLSAEDLHYIPEGNRKVAEILLEYYLEKGSEHEGDGGPIPQ